MARSIGFVTALGAGAILLLLALAEPQAFAVEDTDDSGGGAKASKSCPSGQRFSEKKHGCVRTSCGTGQVWSSSIEACVDGNSAALTDDDIYLAGRDLGQQAHYAEALKLFFRVKNREQARVLNSIGYSTRKLGDVDKGTITTRRWRSIPATPRCANISARLICKRVTWRGRKSSSLRSQTAAAGLAMTMSFWSRRSPRTSPARRSSTGRLH
jgi:hypothetical protein